MAKVTGPLLSMSASGSVAGAMVFSTSKGRPYVRQLVIPANPDTDAQKGVRASMSGLNKLWAAMLAAAKATWQAAATQANISTWNAFVARNQKDMAAFGEAPQREDPVEASDPPGIPTSVDSAVSGSQVTISWERPLLGDEFGTAVWVSPDAGFTPAPANLRGIVAGAAAPADPEQLVLSGFAAGTYYFRVRSFDYAGEWGTVSAENSFVVA